MQRIAKKSGDDATQYYEIDSELQRVCDTALSCVTQHFRSER